MTVKKGFASIEADTFHPLLLTEKDPSMLIQGNVQTKGNGLISALPHEELDRLKDKLEPVKMHLGMVLSESGDNQNYVYFPTTAVVSLLYVLEDGSSAEMAVIGREGCVGSPVYMGGQSTVSRAVVQSAGDGLKLKASLLKEEFARGGDTTRLLLKYTQALMTQMAQVAVCNRHHTLDQQLCRWLLQTLDRIDGNEIIMTQELIANMLGVRREGVTHAASKLQHDGLIAYSRGHIRILDRAGLEKRTCECYGVMRSEYRRLLPQYGTAANDPIAQFRSPVRHNYLAR
jgi:CRP-like cAMP-binding protein